ncbi:cobalamin binding intrinsic factor-like [Haliotis rubra]|uniref:cobalamin binding intrinsic factor-like n=1 Tax=Haliotis rubra TaxID=36100 RepID=UPI001EE618B4|nr:cobalamin binding intrinsic factor-like [Haliotis rubra]
MSTLSCVCLLACVALTLTCPPCIDCPCCMCGPNITVTMEVQNRLQPPTFKSSTEVEMHQRELIYFLQAAVAQDQQFQFTAQYYATPSVTGYFILSMNKLSGSTTNRTYWQILDDGTPTPVGVSQYVPKNGAVITFNYTRY